MRTNPEKQFPSNRRDLVRGTVQRLPEYLDPLDETETARADLKQPLNRLFGRRLAIIAFQWLPGAAV